MTHDSVGLGEDGPTHQPIEHLASLRAMPGLTVIRPADSTEVKGAWITALETDGPVALMGDAAHAMYPTGSNGASQAIIDARVLGAAMLDWGVTPEAVKHYDDQLCTKVSELVLRNRSAGPFGLLNILNERCGGIFEDIETVIPLEERTEFMSKYKAAAGFAIEALNKAPPTIAPTAKFK